MAANTLHKSQTAVLRRMIEDLIVSCNKLNDEPNNWTRESAVAASNSLQLVCEGIPDASFGLSVLIESKTGHKDVVATTMFTRLFKAMAETQDFGMRLAQARALADYCDAVIAHGLRFAVRYQ